VRKRSGRGDFFTNRFRKISAKTREGVWEGKRRQRDAFAKCSLARKLWARQNLVEYEAGRFQKPKIKPKEAWKTNNIVPIKLAATGTQTLETKVVNLETTAIDRTKGSYRLGQNGRGTAKHDMVHCRQKGPRQGRSAWTSPEKEEPEEAGKKSAIETRQQ